MVWQRREIKKIKKCIESWRKYCPDYEIVEWNEDNFDVYQNAYTKYCYDNKKYAFLSDYARLLIVYFEGGIYYDTDVEVIKPINDLLKIKLLSALKLMNILIPVLVLEQRKKVLQ